MYAWSNGPLSSQMFLFPGAALSLGPQTGSTSLCHTVLVYDASDTKSRAQEPGPLDHQNWVYSIISIDIETGSVTIGCPMKFVESGAIWPVKRLSLPPRSCKSVEALVAPILCVDPHAPHAPLSRCVHFGDLPHHLGLEKPRRPARPRSPVITRLQRQKCIHDLQTHNGSQW